MLQAIRNFHQQFLIGYQLGAQALPTTKQIPNNIYCFGMGGSALAPDLINDYFAGQCRLHTTKNYIPAVQIARESLVFCSSYSGNTEETLEIFQQALKSKAQIVILAHGGVLKQGALRHKIPLVEIPECIQPRCATGYFFGAMLAILEKAGLIEGQKKNLENLEKFLEGMQKKCEEEGRDLAGRIVGQVPIIYGPTELEGICRIWKIKMNENAKIQSFTNVFPELNHNEMVGYTKLLMKPAIIYLKSRFMYPRIGKRMQVMQELLSDRISFFSIELQGKNLLQEMFYAYLVGDYASYFLAQSYGVDPAPVAMVEEFKKNLG